MLKIFTSLLFVLALQGCVSNGVGPEAGDAVVADTDSQAARRAVLPRPHVPIGPAPDVRSSNARLFDQAVVAITAEEYPKAEVLLLEITNDQPELAGPWINLGQVYDALDQPEDARRAFEQAIRANPGNCTAYNELGVLSRQAGDFAGAESYYRACLVARPDFKDAYLNLGILYELYLGKLEEALGAYKTYQSLAMEPNRKVQGWVMDLERRLGV